MQKFKAWQHRREEMEKAARDGALHSLATDPGIHPLVPYFAQFISDEVC